MGAINPVQGVGWNDGVIANCSWGGARLHDVLTHAGVRLAGNSHVCFESYATKCQDDSYFGASVPLGRGMNVEDDVLIAYEARNPLSYPHHCLINGVLDERGVLVSRARRSASNCGTWLLGCTVGQVGRHDHRWLRRVAQLLPTTGLQDPSTTGMEPSLLIHRLSIHPSP